MCKDIIYLVVYFLFLHKNEKESPEEIERAFKLFDIDKTGSISFENLKKIA